MRLMSHSILVFALADFRKWQILLQKSVAVGREA
jgi:hypothetical protein